MDEYIERLKADRRFWSDTEYRSNVLALMRLQTNKPADRSRLIIEEVLTLQEQQESLSAEFLLLNRVQ